jgi:lysophosphatidylcholine acyltransferase/lyso-PAF acetyltransferase
MEVQYLPVYYPSDEEKSDPKLFANNVRQVMARALGVPTTEHAYEDVMLQGEVRAVGGVDGGIDGLTQFS